MYRFHRVSAPVFLNLRLYFPNLCFSVLESSKLVFNPHSTSALPFAQAVLILFESDLAVSESACDPRVQVPTRIDCQVAIICGMNPTSSSTAPILTALGPEIKGA